MAIQLTPEQEQQIRALDINDLTKKYIALRDAKSALTKKHKEDVGKLDAGMTKLEVLMLAWLNVFNVESARTPSGTPYKSTATGATVGDREAFLKFVGDNFAERSVFFTNAVSKDSVKQYMEANKGVPPPGVNWYSEAVVNFKRGDEA